MARFAVGRPPRARTLSRRWRPALPPGPPPVWYDGGRMNADAADVPRRGFVAMTWHEELLLLASDDDGWNRTKLYLQPLIDEVLAEVVDHVSHERLARELLSDVESAACRYWEHRGNTGQSYTLAQYFRWHIGRRVMG